MALPGLMLGMSGPGAAACELYSSRIDVCLAMVHSAEVLVPERRSLAAAGAMFSPGVQEGL